MDSLDELCNFFAGTDDRYILNELFRVDIQALPSVIENSGGK